MSDGDFEPRILAFCCQYCTYNAADLAGSLRLSYPPSIRIIRVMCTGRVDIRHLLRGLSEGADGILVAGCLEGECHFLEGNLRAKKRVDRARQLAAEVGIEPERLRMVTLSASDGPKFAEEATEFHEKILELGPNPVRVRDRKAWEESRDRRREKTTR